MITVNSSQVTINGGVGGAFPVGRTVVLSPYKIAKYETTWELWEDVRVWAVSNGYTFTSGSGYQGHEAAGEMPGTGTTSESYGWTPASKKIRPVSYVSWRDVLVWCNAYSEINGLTPVYTSSSTVLKNAINSTAVDAAVADLTRNGYRLPTLAEWEFAARGGNQTADAWNYPYAGGDSLSGLAWTAAECVNGPLSEYGLHPVGTKGANTLGLHDMDGNVWEWCWDRWAAIAGGILSDPQGPAAGNDRIIKGAAWTDLPNPSDMFVLNFINSSVTAVFRGNNVGFRVAAKQ
jgi:formylglycine-generating enzyme required for sulfatase activity